MKKLRNFEKLPSPAAIIFIVILLAMICTWVIPGGEYVEVMDPDTGFSGITAESYRRVDHVPIMPWSLPYLVVQSAINSAGIVIMIYMGTYLVQAASDKGMIDALIGNLCKKFNHKKNLLIILFTLIFAVLGIVVPPQCFLGFVGTMILFSISLGYDAIVGVSVVMLGTAVSSSTGPISGLTAIMQDIVGLPIYSGLGVRFLVWFILLVITLLYLNNYANKIKKDPSKSPIYEFFNKEKGYGYTDYASQTRALKTQDIVVLVIMILTFVVIVIGSTLWNWSLNHISGALLGGAVIINAFTKTSIRNMAKMAIKSLGLTAGMIVVIVMANTVSIILTEGNIMATVIHSFASLINYLPNALIPVGVVVLITILNVILPSGSAKAVILILILGPMGQLIGMSAQTTILAYNFGDGFSNFVIPHDATNISYLEAAKIPYPLWLKFMNKLFVLWMLACSGILTVLYFTGYGPF